MSRVTATERMQRILAILPWIVQHQGTTVDEICERFDIGRDELIGDLEFVFYNVGLHPFTPDMLAEVTFDDDRVSVHIGEYFRRPLRLSHEEALTLLAAGRALAARTGSDPDRTLARAVDKLASVLGDGAAEALEVGLGRADPATLSTVQQAVAEQRELQLDYYSHSRDTVSTRRVNPHEVVSREGHWYLLAHCHDAEGERLFRIDRIRGAELTERRFDAVPRADHTSWDLSRSPRTVELITTEDAAWVARTYPCDEVEDLPDGRLRIVLPVTATAWLERLLVRLDPQTEARDVATGEDLSALGAAAAARLLRRYRDPAGPPRL